MFDVTFNLDRHICLHENFPHTIPFYLYPLDHHLLYRLWQEYGINMMLDIACQCFRFRTYDEMFKVEQFLWGVERSIEQHREHKNSE